jgi:hypothetical protein
MLDESDYVQLKTEICAVAKDFAQKQFQQRKAMIMAIINAPKTP